MEVLKTSLTITTTTTTPDIEKKGNIIVSIIFMSVILFALFMFLIFILYMISIKYSEYINSRRLNIQVNNYKKKSTQNFNKLYKEKNELSDINCCICLNNKCEDKENSEDKENNIIVSLKCGHDFHKKCIDKWFLICKKEKNNIHCPICRNNLNNV